MAGPLAMPFFGIGSGAVLRDISLTLNPLVKMVSPLPTCPSHSRMTYKSIHPTSPAAMKWEYEKQALSNGNEGK